MQGQRAKDPASAQGRVPCLLPRHGRDSVWADAAVAIVSICSVQGQGGRAPGALVHGRHHRQLQRDRSTDAPHLAARRQ